MRDAKDARRQAKDRHRQQQRAPRLLKGRSVRQAERHAERTDRRRGLEQSQAGRPNAQDIARKDRQEGRRAPQQHREQIQRNRRQNHLGAAQKGQPLRQRAQRRSLAERKWRLLRANQQQAENHHRDRQRVQQIHRPRASGQRNQQTAEGRSPHRGQLPGTTLPGRAILVGALRHHLRKHRRSSRTAKRFRNPQQQQAAIDQKQRPLQEREQQQAQDAKQSERAGRDHHTPAVRAIDQRASGQRERHNRQHLDQSHQAQGQGRTCALIKLPADRHHQHLLAQRREKGRQDKQAKIPGAQRLIGIMAHHNRLFCINLERRR